MKNILTSLATLAVVGVVATQELKRAESSKSGLVDLGNGDDMFYWLFNSRSAPSTDPLVMWLTGGPGCASGIALFYENGPFKLDDDLTLINNAYSWNEVSNLVFVDNPVGTGFSYCSDFSHYDTTEEQIAAHMKTFVQGFVAANQEF